MDDLQISDPSGHGRDKEVEVDKVGLPPPPRSRRGRALDRQGPAPLLPPLQKRTDLFSQIKQYLGKDVMSMVSVPVWIMEPFTALQKMAEIMEYPEYLDKARGLTRRPLLTTG